ncbi:hypothetical protein BAUCODRAFT_214384 [Baudoinia panamericana UAMH 10762]|uniref:Uncharacterized protein n=1 Tax=Baudoinia panamericana (strain UAMH 10762) TaxID=717646 RepID=M2N4H9_BAUPA|nr:uncharacterized protein BAUCODRAFT_214384 [Baudoinia panamericana UAMH 10762]EMC93919.1 hypothetical protein BAUCODRAFT_214384 [Baudoinia panamericana UAMH 10762]
MAATRPMEDFFCTPTATYRTVPNFSRLSTLVKMPSTEYAPSTPSEKRYTMAFDFGKHTPEHSMPIKDFQTDQMFWRGYTSDEEVASPLGTDDMSFRTASSDDFASQRTSIESSLPEQLIQSCDDVEQRCGRAQAVRVVSAGKAKVVSMPKLVDGPSSPRIWRPASAGPVAPPVSRFNRSGASSQASSQHQPSPRASTDLRRTLAPQATSVPLPKRSPSLRRRPSLPQLFTAARSSPTTPTPAPSLGAVRGPWTADFLKHDPYPSIAEPEQSVGRTAPITPTSPMSSSRRRLQKVYSSVGLNVFARSRRTNSSDGSVNEELNPAKQAQTAKVPSRSAEPTIERKPSVRPKLVPRGASEREPPLVLPPCPEDYEDPREGGIQWPARDGSSTMWPLYEPAPKVSRLQRQQRSMSVALVSAQA